MNAIEFKSAYTKNINNFFEKCLEYEKIPLNKMQDITMFCSDYGFNLRLETDDNVFTQEFEVDDREINALHYETH